MEQQEGGGPEGLSDPFAVLPSEVCLSILSFLPSIASLVTVGRVNHLWHHLTEGLFYFILFYFILFTIFIFYRIVLYYYCIVLFINSMLWRG